MNTRNICSRCVTLSHQYGPNSLRNISRNLLDLCHEEFRNHKEAVPHEVDDERMKPKMLVVNSFDKYAPCLCFFNMWIKPA